jgi:uncharacterized cupin superfamily protein
VIEEARLESVSSGLAPVTPGWFVVNARDAAWTNNDHVGGVCIFESDDFVLRDRPDLEEYVKPAAGFSLRVMAPGQATSWYHAESVQEDFLVVAGECILIVEEEERRLRAWDYVHCPVGTAHALVGAGDGPCVLVCAGNRDLDDERFWRESRPSEVARRHGASGDQERLPADTWKVERPPQWPELPWSHS